MSLPPSPSWYLKLPNMRNESKKIKEGGGRVGRKKYHGAYTKLATRPLRERLRREGRSRIDLKPAMKSRLTN